MKEKALVLLRNYFNSWHSYASNNWRSWELRADQIEAADPELAKHMRNAAAGEKQLAKYMHSKIEGDQHE